MKRCPNCAAELPDDAVFCSECGTKIDETVNGALENAQPELSKPRDKTSENMEGSASAKGQRKTTHKKNIMLPILIGIVCVLALIAVIIFKSASKPKSEIYCTVEDIWVAYYVNAAGASEQFDGKCVCVSGVVEKIGTDYVILHYSDGAFDGEPDAYQLQTKCFAKNKKDLLGLSIGDHISATGTVSDGDGEYAYYIKRASFDRAFDVATMMGRGTDLQDTVDRSDFLSNTSKYSGEMIGLNCEVFDISYTTITVEIAGEFSYGNNEIGSMASYVRFKVEGDNPLIDVGDACARLFSVGDKVYVDGECFYSDRDSVLLILNPNIVIVEKANNPEENQFNGEDTSFNNSELSSFAPEAAEKFYGTWMSGDYMQQIDIDLTTDSMDILFSKCYGDSWGEGEWWTGWSLSLSPSDIIRNGETYFIQGQASGFDSTPFNVKITIEETETRTDIFEYLMQVETDSEEFPSGTFRWG